MFDVISAKIYSDICPWTLSVPRGEQLVNLQIFYDAPFASIYRDFMMPRHLQTFYIRNPHIIKSL